MELLIPGLILVALMVYASTRIKKTAARAFEPETIETDDFVIQKPEGMLNVIGGDPQYAFEAYSRDFGGTAAENTRRATAKLTVRYGVSMDEAAAEVRAAGSEVVSDINEVVGERRYRIIESTRIEKGVALHDAYKMAERNAKLYQLEVTTIAETTTEFMRNIEAMIVSFEIK